MDIRKFLSRKRARETDLDSSSDTEADEENAATNEAQNQSMQLHQDSQTSHSQQETVLCSRPSSRLPASACAPKQTKAQKRREYKSHPTYNSHWEMKYGWVHGDDPKGGMFCRVCQKSGTPPPSARGAWTTRGITDWNHVTEMLKQHNTPQWHRDAVVASRMAEQAATHQNVLQMQCSAAAKEAEERRQRNREVLLKLIRSVYFLAKNHTSYHHIRRLGETPHCQWR